MNIELPRRQLDLSSAIAEADIRCLLMVLVHMTGDERWLEPPYKPKRDVRLIPDPDAGVPAHTLSVGYVFPDYHRPGDEWPKLDYENMAKVDRTVALAVYRLAESLEAPQWNKEIPNTERYIKARQGK